MILSNCSRNLLSVFCCWCWRTFISHTSIRIILSPKKAPSRCLPDQHHFLPSSVASLLRIASPDAIISALALRLRQCPFWCPSRDSRDFDSSCGLASLGPSSGLAGSPKAVCAHTGLPVQSVPSALALYEVSGLAAKSIKYHLRRGLFIVDCGFATFMGRSMIPADVSKVLNEQFHP